MFKKNVKLDYREFFKKYKSFDWYKTGEWSSCPRFVGSLFRSSESKEFLNKYPVINYLMINTETFIDQENLNNIYKLFQDNINNLRLFYDLKDKENIKVKNLLKSVDEGLYKKDIKSYLYKLMSVTCWFELNRNMGDVLEKEIDARLKKNNMNLSAADLLENDTESEVALYHQAIKRIAVDTKDKNKDIKEYQVEINEIIEKYGYIKTTFTGGEGYTINEIIKEIEQLDLDKKDEKKDIPELPKDIKELVAIMNMFSHWRMIVYSSVNKAFFFLKHYIRDCYDDSLFNLPLEFFYKKITGEKIDENLIGENCATISTDNDYFITRSDFDNFQDKISQKHNTNIIKGNGVSPGKVTSKVKVVMKVEEFDKFKKGDILVCSMTDPHYVPLMKMSSAIITNIGGILCHAAIIARELKKPCIIGTENATKILKDGDMVEVNADNGVIKIIK